MFASKPCPRSEAVTTIYYDDVVLIHRDCANRSLEGVRKARLEPDFLDMIRASNVLRNTRKMIVN